MAKIHLTKSVSHTSLLEAIAASDSLGLAGESFTFVFPAKAFVSSGALALLCV